MRPPDRFETDRLQLRLPVMEDGGAIFEQYAQDAEVTKYLTWRPHQRIESVYAFVGLCLRARQEGKSFQWVIVRKEDNQLVGMLGCRIEKRRLELGYVLARAYWGNGYMTEAVQTLVKWALQQDEIYRVWAVCDIENKASARVMEKVGMQREGILRRWSLHPNRSDEPRDSYCYAIIK